jgi:DNA helicase-2/ATP-dependent DNA helicase PcrA
MAAARLGFGKLENDFKGIGQTFRDGTLVELAFLMKIVAPLLKAKREQNNFAVMKILREYSPLLTRENLQATDDQLQLLSKLSDWVDALVKLWDNGNVPTCLEIYKLLSKTKLFELPKRIEEILSSETEVDERILTLREGLNTSFTEVERYWDYINENTQFSTHQGIKGLEFERVAVIMDDESAGGFLFSYDKLFGAKALTKTDIENEREGKDTAILRTTRLFYVTCTRARESLALIAYTASPADVRKTVLANGWFTEDEVITITT